MSELQAQINMLREEFENYRSQRDIEFQTLQDRLNDLEEKKKKRAKKEIEQAVDLQEFKEGFVNSRPEDRTDPFTNEELVLFFTYIKIKENPSDTERITNFSELYKRVSKIKLVLSHYIEVGKNSGIAEDKLDQFSRSRTKDYLEYMIRTQQLDEKKQINFYFVTSQYCLNNYGNNVGSWQKIKNLDDSPLD